MEPLKFVGTATVPRPRPATRTHRRGAATSDRDDAAASHRGPRIVHLVRLCPPWLRETGPRAATRRRARTVPREPFPTGSGSMSCPLTSFIVCENVRFLPDESPRGRSWASPAEASASCSIKSPAREMLRRETRRLRASPRTTFRSSFCSLARTKNQPKDAARRLMPHAASLVMGWPVRSTRRPTVNHSWVRTWRQVARSRPRPTRARVFSQTPSE
jgi:hypothetical protein